MNTTGLRAQCEAITKTRYKYPLDNGPVSYSPPKSHYRSSRKFLQIRKFLNTNYTFVGDRKIRIV